MKDDRQGKDAGLGARAGKSSRRSSTEISGKSTEMQRAGGAPVEWAEDGRLKVQGVPGSRSVPAKSDLAEQIGVRLRGVYDDVLAQPVPDRFLELLRKLEGAPTFVPAKKGET